MSSTNITQAAGNRKTSFEMILPLPISIEQEKQLKSEEKLKYYFLATTFAMFDLWIISFLHQKLQSLEELPGGKDIV